MKILVAPIHLDALILPHATMAKDALADYARLPYTDKNKDFNSDTPYVGEAILNHPFQDKNLLLPAGIHLHWSLPKGMTKAIGFRSLKKRELDQLKVHFAQEVSADQEIWGQVKDEIWRTLLVKTNWIRLIHLEMASVLDSSHIDQTSFNASLSALLNQAYWSAVSAEEFLRSLHQLLQKPLESEYPSVPDVWVLTRKIDGKVNKHWLIESGFISSSTSIEEGNHLAVNVPFHDDRHDNKSQPYRFMGRQSEFSNSWHSKLAQRDNYLNEITAVGYNPQSGTKGYAEPTFAAFYPNSMSVFGFHDPDFMAGQENLTYEVLGLYTNPNNDYLKQFLADFSNRIRDNNKFIDGLKEALNFEFLWEIAGDSNLSLDDHLPEQVALFGKTVPKRSKKPSTTQIEIAVGNTGTEALSAYVASKMSSNEIAEKHHAEELLESIQFSAQLQNRVLDIGHKFQEARHDKGFTAFPGGTLWSIKLETITPQKATEVNEAPHYQAQLPENIARLLNQVNTLQVAYDKAARELPQMRRQLFSDWYRYMLGAYPPVDNLTAFFDSDMMMAYIRECSIEPLQEKFNNLGTLAVALDENGRFQNASAKKDSSQLASQLAKQLTGLALAIESFNDEKEGNKKSWKEKGKCLALRPTAAPRYWRPNDPVVLFAQQPRSNQVKGLRNLRHATPKQTEAADCFILEAAFNDPNDFTQAEVLALFSTVAKIFENSAETAVAEVSHIWNPFMLEWEIEFLPAYSGSNQAEDSRRYKENFVQSHYQLKETNPDFTLNPNQENDFQNGTLYTGSTILTPNAGVQLDRGVKQFLADHGKDQPAHIVNLLKEAEEILAKTDALSQSLGGFHEALVMQKQTRQLDVADPLGFPEYQAFTAEVAPLVQKYNLTAPQPLTAFHPIRSGRMRILNLRLVDSFGQTVDIEKPTVVSSETIAAGESSDVHLKPRLTQPARLNFRFLSASQGEQEMNAHPASTPVCGWLVPNNLDKSIMVYDVDGRAMGSLTLNGSNPWRPAPDSSSSVTFIESIKNIHLRKVVRYLFGQQTESLKDSDPSKIHFLEHFIGALDSAQENIAPDNFAEHQDLAILMGNPVAVVRAKLDLELENIPALDQSWTQLALELGGHDRSSDDFTKVKFPIRLGEHKQLNDGLVGYWQETAGGRLASHYVSSEASPNPNEHIVTYHKGGDPLNIQHAIDDDPVFVTMLIDPKGKIHAASGILPVKSISLPKDQFTQSLKQIAVTFLTAPVISTADHLKISLPREPGYAWSWIEATPDRNWREIMQTVVIERDLVESKFPDHPTLWHDLIQRKWLKPDKVNPHQATVTAAVHRAFPPNAEGEPHPFPPDIGKRLDAFFDSYGKRIEPFDLHASLAGTQIIREGWLRLEHSAEVDDG